MKAHDVKFDPKMNDGGSKSPQRQLDYFDAPVRNGTRPHKDRQRSRAQCDMPRIWRISAARRQQGDGLLHPYNYSYIVLALL